MTTPYNCIYNEKVKHRIISEKRDLVWHPLSFYHRMFWCQLSTIHTWPPGYWVKHINKHFTSVQYIIEGEMKVCIDGNEYVIKAGEAVVIPPCTCKLSTSGKNGCRKFYFIPDGQMFYNILHQLQFDQIGIIPASASAQIMEFYKPLSNMFEQKKVDDIPVASAMIFSLIMDVADKTQHSQCPEKLAICMNYIQKHIAEPISLESLASIVNSSKTTLKELFAKYLRTSPGRYICDTRLNYAKSLLSKQHISIKTIAFMCGYENPLYFSNAFKHKFGVSPRRFRQAQNLLDI